MANVPIVTEVTKAQLDALVAANGMNEGLQYKVTDKDWLLIAISNNELMSLKNYITIMNGDTVPTYIYTNIVCVDTGILTEPFGVLPEHPYLQITAGAGYHFVSAFFDNLTGEYGPILVDAVQLTDEFLQKFTFINGDANGTIFGNAYLVDFQSNTNPGIRIISRFEKDGVMV